MKKILILLAIFIINTEKDKMYCDIKGNINKPGVYEIKENYNIQDLINDAGGLKKNSYTKNINLSKKVKDEMVIYIFTNDEIKNAKKINTCECTPVYKYIDCEKNKVEDINMYTTSPTTTITSKKENITDKKSTTTKPSTKKENNITTTITNPEITTNKITTTITSKSTTTNIIHTTKIEPTTKITEPTTTNIIIEENLININTATLEELVSLKGLGEKKANAIIEYRINNGPFFKLEDIMNVSGIGKTTYENIKEYITI